MEKEEVPPSITAATIASLSKKGDTQNLANYRPISLLNCVYEIIADAIQIRISEKVDEYIQDTQFGFRKNKSTAQAPFISRRMQDLAEQTGDPTAMLFLDWEKAFDKIDQERMLEALGRLNIPPKTINMIRAIYANPTFQVKIKDESPEVKRQKSGIRQGCPLSPYLFISGYVCYV